MVRVNYSSNTAGIILLDKPVGKSSNSVVQIIKHIYKVKKVGHTGTLDPLASGLLPICLGRATKFSQYLLSADKTYQFKIKLGLKTTTADLEGDILIQNSPPLVSIQQIEKVLHSFYGSYMQKPPIFSAIKHKGKPMYYWARKGVVIEQNARLVTISQLKLKSYSPEGILELEVKCSKGTYVRSLAEDIAEKLGTVGCISSLCRTQVGECTAANMVTLELLQESSFSKLEDFVLPVDEIITTYAKITLSDKDADELVHHKTVCTNGVTQPSMLRLYKENGKFLGIGQFRSEKLQLLQFWSS